MIGHDQNFKEFLKKHRLRQRVLKPNEFSQVINKKIQLQEESVKIIQNLSANLSLKQISKDPQKQIILKHFPKSPPNTSYSLTQRSKLEVNPLNFHSGKPKLQNNEKKAKQIDKAINPEQKCNLKTVKNYNFMRQTGHVKKKLQQQIQQKALKQKYQIESAKIKYQHSLKELYQEKTDLYSKSKALNFKKQKEREQFIKDKTQKQMKEVTFHPKINKIDGQLLQFSERMKIYDMNKQINKAQILSQALKDLTFHPKTNTKPNQSQIKSGWMSSKCSSKILEEEQEYEQDAMKGISQSMIKTGSFFSDGIEQND